jgi:hypothetical protein
MRHSPHTLAGAALVFAAAALVGCDATPTDATTQNVTQDALDARGRQPGPDGAAEHTYQVTIRNLTVGQPFSPGVIVTHEKSATVWEVGGAPSALLIDIAEDGLSGENLPAGVTTAGLIDGLRSVPGVYQVVATGIPIDDNAGQAPPAPQPPSVNTFEIKAAASANRLSVAVMIICTNDGFTGVSGVKLPRGRGQSTTFRSVAYDAGSEQNTEQFPDIVDPCQVIGPQGTTPAIPNGNNGPSLPADGNTIAHHAGIQGVGDLEVDRHGWTGPVAEITVTRVR